ncbi:MAG: DUF881 domain-containing protein [Aldersonia sp.]|nr:DUF881 domain-containing protein [Aldersonia sp.]
MSSRSVVRGRGRPVWQGLVLIVCALAGLLLATTRHVSHGNELRSSDSARLSDLVRTAQVGVDAAEAERDALSDRVQALQREAAGSDQAVARALALTDELAPAAGMREVSGPGVVVTLTDASRDAQGNYPAGAAPDDLVVHQQDVQSVLNALWAGGAGAIGMQDQRLVATSAPRCIGNTLLLHGRTYSPPYRVTATGDPARLVATIDAEPGVRTFRQYAARYGLGFAVEVLDQVTVPGYDGPVQDRFAQPSP